MTLKQAARLHAYAWKSDPFAYARIMHELKHDYISVEDVISDAISILKSRSDNELQAAARMAGISL